MATSRSPPSPEKKKKPTSEREGSNLLGKPTFSDLQNGRFKCVETGHELLAKDIDSYSHSKRCRLRLVEYALSNKKPPLNMFKQDPQSRSKIICKLTGDTVNKSEEHIWKHINGKRFLNKLEQVEEEKTMQDDLMDDIAEGKEKDLSKQKKENTKKNKKEKQKFAGERTTKAKESSEEDADSDDADFWMPPAGERWDFDDGGDRWGSSAESGQDSEDDHEIDGLGEDGGIKSEEISIRKKRASKEIGPSSCASKKKKSKKSVRGGGL